MKDNLLNIKIEIPGLDLLAQAIIKVASLLENQGNRGQAVDILNTMQPIPTAPVQGGIPVQQPASAPGIPVAGNTTQVPVTPMQGAVPVQTAPVGAVPTQIPTTAVPAAYTSDELAVAASQLVNMGKQARLLDILHGLGVNSLMELPKEQYTAFAGYLKTEGVKL